jgi:2-polyprenyl-6-methoxyphenol hydroxylase-like FAD-dependent oxidoreductase
MAAREMGGLSLTDALALCELLAATDPKRYERAALRWLQRFVDERRPPLTEVALAASALAELRHGRRNAGADTLKCACSTADRRGLACRYPKKRGVLGRLAF